MKERLREQKESLENSAAEKAELQKRLEEASSWKMDHRIVPVCIALGTFVVGILFRR